MILHRSLLEAVQKNFSGRLFYLTVALIVFFYIVLMVEPHLVYYSLQPFFTLDPSYFDYLRTEHLGTLSIFSNFILQFTFFPILGALFLTILLLLLMTCYSLMIRKAIGKGLRGIELIPVFIILVFFKEYESGLQSLVILFIAFLILFSNRNLPGIIPVEKFIFHSLIILGAYVVFDIITALTVTLFLVLDEIIFLRTRGKLILSLWDLFVLVCTGYFIVGNNVISTYSEQVSLQAEHARLPQFWPLITSHFGIIIVLKISSLLKSNSFLSKIPLAIKNNLIIIVLLILLIPFGKKYFVNSNKYYTEMGYFDSIEAWDKVLALRHKVTIDDRIPRFLMNRALCFSGRMPDHLFSIPQEWGVHSLLLTMEYNRETTIHSSNLFFDMGFIQGAQYWALEGLTYKPYSPQLLNRLIQCAILLDNEPAAKKYLAVLEKSPIYRKSAKRIIRQLNSGEIKSIKKDWLGDQKATSANLYINNLKPNLDLSRLLEVNPNNQVVYEYLMSYYLLKNHIGNFMHYLPYVENFKFEGLPKIYEEALLFYYLSNDIPVSEYTYKISKKTMEQMMKFNKTLVEYRYDENSARPDLYKNFGRTYWYYLRYKSPETTGGGIKKKGS